MTDPLADPSPVLPAATDIFLPEEPAAVVSPPPPRRIPGPGLGEALAWTLGVIGAQISAGIIVAAVMMIVHAVTTGQTRREQLERAVDFSSIEFIGGVQLLFTLMTILAAGLRLYPHSWRRLSLQVPSLSHIILTILLVLPLSVLCTSVYIGLYAGWKILLQYVPGLESLDEFSSMKMVEKLTQNTSLPMLVLVIAVSPAIAEELVFRGVIGRGLIARWGTIWGIVITSVLFGLVHLHPVHAIAVMPLGAAMHVVYLRTRTIVAPMLMHFWNNALSSVSVKHPDVAFLSPVPENREIIPLLLASALLTAAIFWMFSLTRREFLLPNGTPWTPGYPAVEAPPPALETQTVSTPAPLTANLALAAALLLFVITIAVITMK